MVSKSPRVMPERTFLAGTRPGALSPGTCSPDAWGEGDQARARWNGGCGEPPSEGDSLALTVMAFAAAGMATSAASAARRPMASPSRRICGTTAEERSARSGAAMKALDEPTRPSSKKRDIEILEEIIRCESAEQNLTGAR